MKKYLAILALMTSVSAFSKITEYRPAQLLARTNLFDTYNLPELSFLNNTYPTINNRGDVAFKVLGSEGHTAQSLWIKRYDDVAGKILYTADEDFIISDPSLNDLGELSFSVADMTFSQGIFKYDLNLDITTHVLNPENDALLFYTYPQTNKKGELLFRGTDQNNTRSFFLFDGKLKTIATEGNSVFKQSTSYLFKLTMNEEGAIAFKRRLGEIGDWKESNPDEIVLMKPSDAGFETTIVVQDTDSDPKSEFKSLPNTVGMNDKNEIAFIVTLTNNKKALVMAKDGKFQKLAVESENGISEIESFEPKINNNGLVAFRAKDLKGKRSIFVATADEVKKLISEGDEVETDKGMGRILSNPQYPGFGGDVDLNDNGDIVYYCLIVDAKNGIEWGSAVYQLSPKK